MILKISKSGIETGYMCRTTVPVPFSARGLELLSINLPPNAGEFSQIFENAITVNGFVVTVPAQGSIDDMIDYLNNIDTPNRALFVYLHDNELEICSGQYAVVFSTDFKAFLGISSVNLAANDCVNVTLHLEKMNPVSEYAVEVSAPIQGVFYENAYTDIVGFVDGPKGKPLDNHFFKFESTPASIRVSVYYRKKADGKLLIAACDSADRWSVSFRIIQ